MPDPSTISFEFLKKEAKALLRRCRAGDSQAINRVRPRLPRLTKLDDERMAEEIKLADIQHVLAIENNCANWSELKRVGSHPKAGSYSSPGSAGTLPEGFVPWRWSVSYTVRPEMLCPLPCGEEYRIGASVLRNRPSDNNFIGYADMYERALAVVTARAAELRCQNECDRLHTRILAHTWFRHANTDLVRAAVTLGVTCLNEGIVGAEGESIPTRDALAVPGGITAEQLAGRNPKAFDEIYSDGDIRTESEAETIFQFSYGEYVHSVDGLDFRPYLDRAERLARIHIGFQKDKARSNEGFPQIVRREWFCATNPNIAVIHVFVQR